MQVRSTILAVLSCAALSVALAVEVHIANEGRKELDWAVAQHPISILGGKLKNLSDPQPILICDTPLPNSSPAIANGEKQW